jgi:hypothetical protein
MRAVPHGRVERAGDGDRAARANRFGQRQPLGDVGKVCRALRRVGVEHVAPRADFGDDDVFGVEGLPDRTDAFAIGDRRRGAVRGAVAEAPVLLRKGHRVVGLEEDRAAEPDGLSARL